MVEMPDKLPVTAVVDANGRLVAADAPILALQQEAGGSLGMPMAVPQLAAIASLASKLGVPVERRALAGTATADLDLWVRADPTAEGVVLSVEQWSVHPPSRPRALNGSAEAVENDGEREQLSIDAQLRIVGIGERFAQKLGTSGPDTIGRPLTAFVRLIEDREGDLPLLSATIARKAFAGQGAIVRDNGEVVHLEGEPIEGEEGFAGYAIRLCSPPADNASDAALPIEGMLEAPLSSIIDQAKQIANRADGPLRTEYAGYGADISTAANHLLGLLTSLSADKSSSPDGDAPAAAVIDLGELVLEAAGFVQPQARARDVTLDIDGEARLSARGDGSAVTQILINLMANAVRFSPTGATVVITLSTGATSSVTVSDNGPGVAPKDRARIFERFDQGSTPGEGSGLGLAISRRLARAMGGEVELVEGDGGASFRLSLRPA